MSDTRLTRRRVLTGAAGLVGATGVAGCTAQATASLEPKLPEERLRSAGWTHREDVHEERTESIDVAGEPRQVDVEARAEIYGNDAPVHRAADRLDLDDDRLERIPGEVFVATKAQLDPPVHRLFEVSDSFLVRAMDFAEAEVERSLEEQGFRDVRRVADGTLDIEAADDARHRVYRGVYPYDGFETTHDGHDVYVKPGSFTVEAQLAVWPYRGLLAAGAGVYPGEVGRLKVSVGGTARKVELGFEPKAYRADVRALLRLIA